jgi:5-hydroxyisourate hydrolase-like protein (transthyretin family)
MHLSCTDDNSREFQQFTTDAEGRFETKIPEKSQARILIRPSYTGDYILDREQDGREVFSGQLNQDTTGVEVRARVWPVATLQGRVLDAHGKPAANVSIYLHSNVPPFQSGQDGGFTLTLAPTDRDFDLLALDGRKAAALTHCKAGTREAVLKLAPLSDYAGKAVPTAGRPADNLQFRLCPMLNSTTLSGPTWAP